MWPLPLYDVGLTSTPSNRRSLRILFCGSRMVDALKDKRVPFVPKSILKLPQNSNLVKAIEKTASPIDIVNLVPQVPVEELNRMQSDPKEDHNISTTDQINVLRNASSRIVEEGNSVLTHVEAAKLLNSLLKLRKACCHPQVRSSGLSDLQQSPMTMGEILMVLVGKTKVEGDEALRKLVVAVNGLARIDIIKQEFSQVVSLYKESLELAEKHSQDFRVDPLLNIHIHYNLAEILPLTSDSLQQSQLGKPYTKCSGSGKCKGNMCKTSDEIISLASNSDGNMSHPSKSDNQDVIKQSACAKQVPVEELNRMQSDPKEDHNISTTDQINVWRNESSRIVKEGNSVLTHVEAAKLLNSLLKLRKACCHPQVRSSGLSDLQQSPMTMEEILMVLVGKTKVEGDEALRKLVVAVNGLAGIAIIKQEFSQVVSLYKESLELAEKHSQDFRVDPLLNIHIHYNLAEIFPLTSDSLQQSQLGQPYTKCSGSGKCKGNMCKISNGNGYNQPNTLTGLNDEKHIVSKRRSTLSKSTSF
nr:E3 ubiquitin-protein ligase SHPRH [Tanacetum cinerariifolium]